VDTRSCAASRALRSNCVEPYCSARTTERGPPPNFCRLALRGQTDTNDRRRESPSRIVTVCINPPPNSPRVIRRACIVNRSTVRAFYCESKDLKRIRWGLGLPNILCTAPEGQRVLMSGNTRRQRVLPARYTDDRGHGRGRDGAGLGVGRLSCANGRNADAENFASMLRLRPATQCSGRQK